MRKTKRGFKSTDKINTLDEVLSFNQNLRINEYKKVLNTKKIKTTKKMLTISNGIDEIRCTEDHRIYTLNRGYIEARFINENDEFLSYK